MATVLHQTAILCYICIVGWDSTKDVADELKALVQDIKRTDQSHRIVQLVERKQAEFGMAVEGRKVVFDTFDPLVIKYGLTRIAL